MNTLVNQNKFYCKLHSQSLHYTISYYLRNDQNVIPDSPHFPPPKKTIIRTDVCIHVKQPTYTC